jgi:hypothetical protein
VDDRLGLTAALGWQAGRTPTSRHRHGAGAVLRDLAVLLADGGDWLSDLAVLSQQPELSSGASTATAWRINESVVIPTGLPACARPVPIRAAAWRAGAHLEGLLGREVVEATAAGGSPGLDSMEHPDCSPALPDVCIGWKCGARLVSRNLWHSCGQFTLEDLFAGTGSGVLELARGYVAMHRWPYRPGSSSRSTTGRGGPGTTSASRPAPIWMRSCEPGSRKRTTSSGCRPTCRTGPAAGQAPAQASDRSFADEPGQSLSCCAWMLWAPRQRPDGQGWRGPLVFGRGGHEQVRRSLLGRDHGPAPASTAPTWAASNPARVAAARSS